MKIGTVALGALVVGAVPAARAQPETEATVPRSAFFAGAGGSYNFVNVDRQSVYNKGISDTYQNGVKTASGTADGPAIAVPFADQKTFAPNLQLGYFQHFGESRFLWGGKLSYGYLSASSTTRNVVVPQYGTSTAVGIGSFDGHSVVGGHNVSIYNQMSLMPIVGRSFERGFLYAGAGPSLSQVKSSANNVVGYAVFNGAETNVSGPQQSFTRTSWTYGVAATAGVTFFLAPSWFLDLGYAYVRPNAINVHITAPFSNPGNGSGNAFAGTLIGDYTANLSTHAITLTINKTF